MLSRLFVVYRWGTQAHLGSLETHGEYTDEP